MLYIIYSRQLLARGRKLILMFSFFFFYMQVGIRGKDIVVLGVEKKSVAKLQEERTVRKICALDEHVCMAFAGIPDNTFLSINE